MSYKEELSNYLKNINLNNQVIYDIGANEGEMINFFNFVSKNSTIYGIEPHPTNFKILEKKFKNKNNIILIHGAINNYDGMCKIGFEQQQRPNGLKQGHIMETETDMQGRKWNQMQHNIKCWKLETICKNATIIKMDIEGFEHNVLHNSLSNIKQVHTWLLEVHSWEDMDLHGWTINNHNKNNDSLNKIIKLFLENGFTNFIPAKNKGIKNINNSTYWTDIPASSYNQDDRKVYYKVVNLIIKK